jgi:uncharacterized protein YlxW (UPF0749 family)
MKFYGQLNKNKICIGISQLSGEVTDENMIELNNFSQDFLWRKYENGNWSAEKYEPQSTAPLTEFEKLQAENITLKEKVSQLETDKLNTQLTLAEVIEKQELDKLEMQLALAEVIESMGV